MLNVRVKKENLYKASQKLSLEIEPTSITDIEDDYNSEESTEDEEGSLEPECFLCKKARYVDVSHSGDKCHRFPTKQATPFLINISSDSASTDLDSDFPPHNELESSVDDENTQVQMDGNYLLSLATQTDLPSSDEESQISSLNKNDE